MGKKITSVMVLVAAMLLSLPSYAQVQKKQLTSGANGQKMEMRSLSKGLKVKSADVAKQKKQLLAKVAKEEAVDIADELISKWDWAAHAVKPFVSTSGKPQLFSMDAKKVQTKNLKSRTGAPVKRAPRYASETDVLVTPPAGVEAEEYTLSLYGATSMSTISTTKAKKVYFDGDDVYVQGLAYYFDEAYVKGTLNDEGQYVFESGQYVGEDEYGPEWIVGCDVDDDNYLIYAPNFVFDFNADTRVLTLVGYYGESGEPDDAYLYDYFLSATFTPGVPETPDLIELPESAIVETWYADGLDNAGTLPSTAKVAFVDNEVYLSGLFADWPNAWIMGTLEGTTVTFPTLQYLGYNDLYGIDFYSYAASIDEFAGTYVALDAITFTYDADAKTLTMDPDQALVLNAATDRMYYLDYITELTLSANEPVIEPNAIPFVADLMQKEEFKKFKVIDNNGDGSTWTWSESNGTYYRYNEYFDADDYLVAPIEVEAGKNYSVTVNAAAYSDWYPERFEVKVGKERTAEGLNITAIGPTDLESQEFMDFEGDFTADETGVWYIAIHAISDADCYYMLVSSLKVELGAEPTAPAAVADFAAVAGEKGALEVNIAFTAPAKAINGSALTGNEDVTIFRDNEAVKTFEGVAAGTKLTWQDTNVEDSKSYTYYVQASNESGAGAKSEKVSVWVGQDIPADVENVQVTAMPVNGLTMTWDPTVGVNGGYIDAAQVKYSVTAIDMEEFWGFQFPVEGETLGTVTGETTATVTYPVDEGDPQFGYFGVKATVGNNESDPTSWIAYALIGAPYELPILETFTGSGLHYVWDYNENTGLGISYDGSDDAIALALTAYEDGIATFETFKLNLKAAANATVVFDAKKGTSTTDKLIIYGIAPDGTTTDLETVVLTNEYKTYKVVVPAALKTERWARIGFKAELEAQTNVIIDNIKILDLYEYDLSVAVSAPKTVVAGGKATITATVKNEGENEATGYTVTIKAGEEVLLEEKVNEALAPFTTKEFTAELATTIFDDAADVTITAIVEYINDLNEDNNTADAIVSIKESTVAPVTTVTAESGNGSILVGWTAPENSTEETTDDIESYEEFDFGGLDGDVHVGNIGEWTIYDANEGLYSYTINGVDVPNLGMQNAWIVMNPGSSQNSQDLSVNYGAHSGSQYFLSSSVYDDYGYGLPTDHWLISPELSGTAQTISFFAREMVSTYGAETFDIMISSTDTNADSFTKLKSESCDVTEWTEYTYDLPVGTKYFAIRHTSDDVWALFVDDITFTVGGGEIDHFNIYLDGELAADAAANAATATLENVAEGEHTVAVSVVYTNGQESKPVVATVSVTTGIDSITVITQPVDVYSLDGKLVRKQTTALDGLKGVYIVDGKKVILK